MYRDAVARTFGGINLLCTMALVGLLIAGCCSAPRRSSLPGDAAAVKPMTSVLIVQVCPDGTYLATGALLNDSEVLTARHATQCANDVEPFAWVGMVQGSDKQVKLRREMMAYGPNGDVARLVGAAGSFEAGPTPVVGDQPRKGDQVCWRHAWPSLGKTCGAVISLGNGLIYIDEPAVQGNSGSAVYDAGGRVVGVLIRGDIDEKTGQFIGPAAAVDLTKDLTWMVSQ